MIFNQRPLQLIIGTILLLLIGICLWIWQLFLPVSTIESESVRFVIPPGQAVSVIAQRLEAAELIKNQYAFRLVLKVKKIETRLQAGSYLISPELTLMEIAQVMTMGTNDTWVTIPEGWRSEEIAVYFANQDLPAFDQAEFISLLDENGEGRLFPDTYLFATESTAQTVYQVLTNTFEQKVTQGLAKEIKASVYDFNDALIMASIVEREASDPEEMSQVAGILWNRIEMGMALQADATLQYATGYDASEESWWSPPLAADKQINSPYNTYRFPGLPPAPISNPGLSAIKSALNPAQSSYLYYLHDRSGVIHYARSLEEHNDNVRQYLR